MCLCLQPFPLERHCDGGWSGRVGGGCVAYRKEQQDEEVVQ